MYAGRGDGLGLNVFADKAGVFLLACLSAGGLLRHGEVAPGVGGGDHNGLRVVADGAGVLLAAVFIAGGFLEDRKVAVAVAVRGDFAEVLGAAALADAPGRAGLGAGGLLHGDKLAPVMAEGGNVDILLLAAAQTLAHFGARRGAGGLNRDGIVAPFVAEGAKLFVAANLVADRALLIGGITARGAGRGQAVLLDIEMVGKLEDVLLVAVLQIGQQGRVVRESGPFLITHGHNFGLNLRHGSLIEPLRALLAVGAGLVEDMGILLIAVAVLAADVHRIVHLDPKVLPILGSQADVRIERRVHHIRHGATRALRILSHIVYRFGLRYVRSPHHSRLGRISRRKDC